jgi:thioredoxin reductase (NADPH)
VSAPGEVFDLLVVGAGPTGIAVGAEARRAGLTTLLVDRGALTQNLLDFPTFMTFFTTRELLEIAGIPFAIPEEKPDRRQALAYYRAVAAHYRLPLALHEEVLAARRHGDLFRVHTRRGAEERERAARAVVLATGYFGQPKRLGVPGETGTGVRYRYRDPYPHFGEDVIVVGGGNSGAEASLELWRGGARVTLVHRGAALKETVKYWLKPDLENRIAEGAIAARFDARVVAFADGGVEIERQGARERLAADAVYVLIGYLPDAALEERCGVRVDPQTLVPACDPASCESNVPGLYIAGTLQAGRDTGRIFIENSRDHGAKIVRHLRARLGSPAVRALHEPPDAAALGSS